jgi:signal transduction histidine kinase
MHFRPRDWIESLRGSLAIPVPERDAQLARLKLVERSFMLPIKLMVVAVLIYGSDRFFLVNQSNQTAADLVLEYVVWAIPFYVGINVLGAIVLFFMERLELRAVQLTVFALGLMDSIILASLTLVSAGYDSVLYWVFIALLLRNAAALPPSPVQLVANLSVCASYVAAGVLSLAVNQNVAEQMRLGAKSLPPNGGIEEVSGQNVAVRVLLLVFVGAVTYGVQVLLEKQRLSQEEAAVFTVREAQVKSASRVAAEVAHQIKNPLAIINNAVFTLRRTTATSPPLVGRQLDLIAEEVERSDRIITELMGYAKLAEGTVEKLNLVEEIERAVLQVFPPEAGFQTQIHRQFQPRLHAVVMQRNHLNEVLTNLLLNAREALAGGGVGRVPAPGGGEVFLSASQGADSALTFIVRDTGPGIPADQVEKVFDAYFTTKPRGSGLGLAIARHNVELYGGELRVHSELGKGASFTITLPTVMPFKVRPT